MSSLYKLMVMALLCLAATDLSAQKIISGKIIDAVTKEPITGASIQCTETGCNCGCSTTTSGVFKMHCKNCKTLKVSFVGYQPKFISIEEDNSLFGLIPSASILNEIVISANRQPVRRAEAPIAIANISSKTIQDAKPVTADQLLNKVSGVNMVNLGNEQHQMSIRQPMTTKSLFLYLEDGIPIRTSGLYNHNALLEMNLAATKSIEVIKGPSSSMYGSEAIGGVVNFITAAPTAIPVLKLSVQGNNVGYKRADLASSVSTGKWGFALSGYYANKKNGFLEYSDFHKGIVTAKIDYRFTDKTTLSNSLTYLNYYSDMAGGIDSIMFASRTFQNLQSFTYRKVDALRYRSTFTHSWNNNSKSTITALYRDNSIGQNPAYRVKDDYRKQGAVFVGKKDLAHGEINNNAFHSYSLLAQHRQSLDWKKAAIIGGFNVDISPSTYDARYIRIKKDSVTKKYLSYQTTDSLLTNYATRLNNYAVFLNFEFTPIEKLRVVGSLRYDYFHYSFNNHLASSAFSGSRDTASYFKRLSPKIGATYNFTSRTGVYANYSEGFVPPQVTELYTGMKVPSLEPSIFHNYEVGGWSEIVRNKLSIDASIYRLEGTNEIISVKLDDGSFANQNAGRTLHQGIELGVNANPMQDVSFRLSGAYSRHKFLDYVEKGISYNGNQMANAPRWLYNTEAWYKPSYARGLRIGAEWQHVGKYYVDPQNTAIYAGYNVLNLRAGYQVKGFDVWINVLNATDNYYSYITSKSTFGWNYQVAEPRNITLGLSYDFANLFKNKK